MKLYPLQFQPVYKEKIWGGSKLASLYGRNLPQNNIGESWEIASHQAGTVTITNGSLQGQSLADIINRFPRELLGRDLADNTNSFPLLIKLLDARKKLSVQVHPDDRYAFEVEGEQGKTEMWYIIDTEPGAKLVYGLTPGTDKEEFTAALRANRLESKLQEVPVSPGDVYFIPAGTVHAVGEGILLAEIQQNSDTTYRVYDYNRPGRDGKLRPLHLKEALEVIDFNLNSRERKPTSPLSYTADQFTGSFLTVCPYFTVERIVLNGQMEFKPAGESFIILLCLTGQGELSADNGNLTLNPGNTILLPAEMTNSVLTGNCQFLKIYLTGTPTETVKQLDQLGFNQQQIKSIPGIENLLD